MTGLPTGRLADLIGRRKLRAGWPTALLELADGDAFNEPSSSCVSRVLDVVQDEDGLHNRGCSVRAAAQPGQNFPDFRVALARSPMPRMRAWARLTFFCHAVSFGR